MRHVSFGARERERMTVTQGLSVLYVVAFFQAVIECLVYPHVLYMLISFFGLVGIGFTAGRIADHDGTASFTRVAIISIVFLAFVVPLRVAVYKFMGVK